MTKMQASFAKQVAIVTADDSESSVLRFNTNDGDVNIALENKELSKLVMLLLGQSEKVGLAKMAQTEEKKSQTSATVHPIQASAVGIGRGRTESENVLFVQVGNLNLAFWTSAISIQQMCGDLGSLANVLDKPQRPN